MRQTPGPASCHHRAAADLEDDEQRVRLLGLRHHRHGPPRAACLVAQLGQAAATHRSLPNMAVQVNAWQKICAGHPYPISYPGAQRQFMRRLLPAV